MKSNIRKFMSMLMVSAMLLSLSTINAFAASTVIDDLPSFERVECDHVEVLEDGGKIYTYVINGVVNKSTYCHKRTVKCVWFSNSSGHKRCCSICVLACPRRGL